jgi:hypothetical protein
MIEARFLKKEPKWPRRRKSFAKDKKGVAKIAKALKRTPGATTVKAAKHGISLRMT